jgi:hypothetical protein
MNTQGVRAQRAHTEREGERERYDLALLHDVIGV